MSNQINSDFWQKCPPEYLDILKWITFLIIVYAFLWAQTGQTWGNPGHGHLIADQSLVNWAKSM